MADNFVCNQGSGGDTFGADDIGGVKYSRTKIIVGADGVNDGDVSSANPLPVSAAQSGVWNVTNVSGTISLPTGAATEATLADIKTAVQLIDNAISGAGFNITQLNGAAVPIGAGTEAAAVRVTLATDSTGVVSIDDNGGSLTVDGTFWQATQPVSIASVPSHEVTNAGTFATQSVVTNAGTFAVQAACVLGAETTKVIGTVNIAAAQTLATVTTVGAVTSLTNALPAGTNAIGKLAANSGVDIGDVDVTSISAGTNTIGGVISQPSTSAAYDGTTACTIKRLSGIATASGANTIIAAVADKKIRVLALSLLATSTTAVVAYIYNGDYMLLGDGTNKLTLDMDGVGGPAGLVMPFNQGGWFQTDTANEALAINLGGATPVIWAITYMEVA